MVASSSGDGGVADLAAEPVVVRRRRDRVRKVAGIVGLSLLLILLVAVAAVWIARRPIASDVLESEFERRGVRATYELERVGLRTQVVRNLTIGDPDDPDLFARYALIQLRVRWNGSIEVYRVLARGVRLEGRVVDGKVSWGELDRMLPPPSDEPFRFPDISVDVADASISLQTPAGPVGFAVSGSGNLTGGFKGKAVARSPGLDFGRCSVTGVAGNFAVAITASRPHIEGPAAASRFACPQSNIAMVAPRFVIDARFSEGFDEFDGSGRISAAELVAGPNGLAALNGRISFEGNPGDAQGSIDLSARRSRLGPFFADRTRIDGRYSIDAESGTMQLDADFSAQDSTLADTLLAGITDPLSGLANTPIGPVSSAIADAIRRSARSFDVTGGIQLANVAGGGSARIESAEVQSRSGARIRVSGGDGIVYQWPSGTIRIDSEIAMQGGGLPTGRVALNQARADGPMRGVARFAPYQVGSTRLALQPVRFKAASGGATEFSTFAQLTGTFPEGAVRDLRVPVSGRFGPNGGFQIAGSCITVSFDYLRFRDLQLGAARLPVCPAGQPAIITQPPGGRMQIGARVANPNLAGRLGNSPLRLAADSARLTGRDFALADVELRLGDPQSPVIVDAAQLQGTFRGRGVTGTMSDAGAVIGNVPLLISDADATWQFLSGDLTVEGNLLVSDRNDEPRFYPLRSNDFRFHLAGSDIDATGTLIHPESGTRVADVTIDHDLDNGAGGAVLDVPGLTFGEQLQPEELTRLTEGVVALVQGTIRGQGRINWSGEGETTSTGEFSTAGTDLAAPFGPVSGLTTTIRFSDLLGLETAPGQVAAVDLINPGIPVQNGVIRYQLLSDQRVKIERGVWPFMGGTLILHETILNFGRPTPKRLTFEVVGFNARTFIDSLGFEGIVITGVFDGVLPMIFDEDGGRVVGGRLDSRPPGGMFRYTGTEPDAGLAAGVAFDLLSDLRYQSMTIRLDGDLAGEFATRFTIRDVSLGEEGGFIASLVRSAFRKVPLIVNLNVNAPFRALIQMAKGFKDPTEVIEPVMPFPLDAPGVVTEIRNLRKEEEQTRTTPLDEVEITPEPPQPSE